MSVHLVRCGNVLCQHVFLLHYSIWSWGGAWDSVGLGLESCRACTCCRAWRQMCSAELCCCYRSAEPALLLCHWFRWSDWQAHAELSSNQDEHQGAWLPRLIAMQAVWTHAGVPVMWVGAKLLKSDWGRVHTHSRSSRASHAVVLDFST